MIRSISEAIAKANSANKDVIIIGSEKPSHIGNVWRVKYDSDFYGNVSGIALGFVIIERNCIWDANFNYLNLEWFLTRIRGDSILRYMLNDGTIVYEGGL